MVWEVISLTSAMVPRWRSKGVATVAAITSGLAPGIEASTTMVGKSTCGSGATGRRKKATAPASVRPSVSSVVATGRRMKNSVRFMPATRCLGRYAAFPSAVMAGRSPGHDD